MSDAQIRRALQWSVAAAIMDLRDEPRAVLLRAAEIESARRKPRVRLLERLRVLAGLPKLPVMPDWEKISAAEWRTMSDTNLAARLGCTPAAVSAARARLGKPASPAGHGGARDGAGRKLEGSDSEGTTAVINLTKGEKRLLMLAHKAAAMTWNDWARTVLLNAAKK